MKNFFLAVFSLILCVNSSCVSAKSKTSSLSKSSPKHGDLISIQNTIMQVPYETALKMGIIGIISKKTPIELMKDLKLQKDVKVVGACNFTVPSGSFASQRSVAEIQPKGFKKEVDLGVRTTFDTKLLTKDNLICLALKPELVISDETTTPMHFIRFDEGSLFLLKDGETSIFFKSYNSMISDSPKHASVIIGFIRATRITRDKEDLDSNETPAKVVRFRVDNFKIPAKLASTWGIDGTPVLDLEKLPGKKAISNMMSAEDALVFKKALLQEKGVMLFNSGEFLTLNKREISFRRINEIGESEFGYILRLTPVIDEKLKTVSFDYNPTFQLITLVNKAKVFSANTIQNFITCKDKHTIMISNLSMANNNHFLITLISTEIIDMK